MDCTLGLSPGGSAPELHSINGLWPGAIFADVVRKRSATGPQLARQLGLESSLPSWVSSNFSGLGLQTGPDSYFKWKKYGCFTQCELLAFRSRWRCVRNGQLMFRVVVNCNVEVKRAPSS